MSPAALMFVTHGHAIAICHDDAARHCRARYLYAAMSLVIVSATSSLSRDAVTPMMRCCRHAAAAAHERRHHYQPQNMKTSAAFDVRRASAKSRNRALRLERARREASAQTSTLSDDDSHD